MLLDAYAFSVVCDGHSGVLVATILGTSFIETLRQQLEGISGTAPVEQLIQVLQAAYTIALGEVDKRASTVGLGRASCGSTITAVVLQRASMICATLQLGDCRAGACNGRTGAILQGKQLFSSEDHHETMHECVTREHSFRDTHEQRRIAEAVHEHGWLLATSQRTDAMESEQRYLGKISRAGREFTFNEPSRGVENPQMYPRAVAEALASAQRVPELVAWQLPLCGVDPVVLFCACDGFFSHKALPSMHAFGRCIVDPEAYMANGCLDDTCMQEVVNDPQYEDHLAQAKLWLPRAANHAWEKDPTECCYQLMAKLAPDADWRNAVHLSWANVERLRASHGGRVPSLIEAPKAAIEMATNLAVLLMSDDNVSIETLMVTPEPTAYLGMLTTVEEHATQADQQTVAAAQSSSESSDLQAVLENLDVHIELCNTVSALQNEDLQASVCPLHLACSTQHLQEPSVVLANAQESMARDVASTSAAVADVFQEMWAREAQGDSVSWELNRTACNLDQLPQPAEVDAAQVAGKTAVGLYQIVIRAMLGSFGLPQCLVVQAEPLWTVHRLKAKIEEATGIPCCAQSLMHKLKALRDEHATLRDCDIQNEGTVVMMINTQLSTELVVKAAAMETLVDDAAAATEDAAAATEDAIVTTIEEAATKVTSEAVDDAPIPPAKELVATKEAATIGKEAQKHKPGPSRRRSEWI